jgi:stearoyl-CoA desaturase (delta-9 desaturase)
MIEILYTLIVTHITIICVTLFLHRGQAHKGIEFHPILSHFMRLWLWLTTGMITRQWVAIHRCHHVYSDRVGDPHSPHIYGIWRVLFSGTFLYSNAAKNQDIIDRYGIGTPDDWIERNIYTPSNFAGVSIMLLIDLALFGPWGAVIWGIQMIWIPFWAAGVINGLAHWIGYRNYDSDSTPRVKDGSHNLCNLGIVVGGEELHNNHHADPSNPKLSHRWFEFDIGWMWLKIFEFLRLAKIRS